MKNVFFLALLIFSSFSIFAAEYSDCRKLALEIAKKDTEAQCEKENGYKAHDYKIQALRQLSKALEGTMAEITYYCEAGQGMIVILKDNRGDPSRKELLCTKQYPTIVPVGAWE